MPTHQVTDRMTVLDSGASTSVKVTNLSASQDVTIFSVVSPSGTRLRPGTNTTVAPAGVPVRARGGSGDPVPVDVDTGTSGPFGRRRSYDVRDYLDSGDTVTADTDVAAAINRAMAAAAADGYTYGKPGQVILPPMSKRLTSSIVPVSGVDLIGSGRTVLRAQGTTCAVHGIFTAEAPLVDATFAGFEIDGSAQTLTNGSYATGTKGFFIQYAKRCTFENLYIHDTAASGLGIDFLDAVKISDVKAWGCGRLNGGVNPGGAGIGIGTGGWQVESFKVSDCDVRNNGRYGLFVERQSAIRSYGAVVQSCYAEGNPYGFVDAGMAGIEWIGCFANANTKSGFAANAGSVGQGSPGRYSSLTACTSRGNTDHGFFWDGSSDTAGICQYDLTGFKAIANGKDGARFATGAALPVTGARINAGTYRENGAAGIHFTGTATWNDIHVRGAQVKNNGTDTGATVRNGIHLGVNISKGVVADNISTDDQTTKTQQYGIGVPSGVTLSQVSLHDNGLAGNATGTVTFAGTLASGSAFRNNPPYNPRGPVTVTVTASPYTYTNAGTSPEVVHIDSGTVSLITKGGSNLRTTTGASVWLEPNEAVTITYTVAPNVKADRL